MKMDSYFLAHDFVICKSDPNVYMMRTTEYLLILVLYVDDLLIIGSSASTIVAVKRHFTRHVLYDRHGNTSNFPWS
jgi:hypothetical protein